MSAAIRDQILDFLRQIGLPVVERPLTEPTFLPGLSAAGGVLAYDPDQLTYPGDLLHEAGHIAVIPGAQRASLAAMIDGDGGEEMAAIAWSYAACLHLGLPPEVVFHPAGYKGAAASLAANFATGRYLGVPILEWRGMTDHQQPGTAHSPTRYPQMKKWLCD